MKLNIGINYSSSVFKRIVGGVIVFGLGLPLIACSGGSSSSSSATPELVVIAGASNGTTPSTTPASPTSVNLLPSGVEVIAANGNKYIADAQGFVEKIDSSTGLLSIIAGDESGATPTTTAVAPTSVKILPRTVALDAEGNLYIADGNGFVEKIAESTGLLSVIAGIESGGVTPTITPSSPTLAKISPNDVVVNLSGDIFITDGYGYVEEIAESSGLISVIAGNNSGVVPTTIPESATGVRIAPGAIALDLSNNLYISDFNGYVEKIADGQLSVIAGSAESTAPAPSQTPESATGVKILPYGVAIDAESNIYIADFDGYVEKITDGQLSIIAGNLAGNAPTTAAVSPTSVNISARFVSVDSSDNIYIADNNGYVEQIVASSGLLKVIAGSSNGISPTTTPESPTLVNITPYGIAMDSSSNIYLADGISGYVEKISSTTGLLSVIAGNNNGVTPNTSESSPTAVLLSPNDVAVDSLGNIYIADNNGYIEKIAASTGLISVIAGNESGVLPNSISTFSPTAVKIQPFGVEVDTNGNIFIADAYNNYVEKIAESTGLLSVIAGAIGGVNPSIIPESPTSVSIQPYNTEIDSAGNIFIADNNGYIEEISESTGLLRKIAGDNTGNAPTTTAVSPLSVVIVPSAVEVDASGNIYIMDSNGYVEEIVASTGKLQVIAGNNNGVVPTTAITLPTSVILSPSSGAVAPNGVFLISDYNGYVEAIRNY